MRLKILVTPLARGAYFDARLDVARAELQAHLPDAPVEVEQVGGLELLCTELPSEALPALARLSFVQAAFEESAGGLLRPLDLSSGFVLPEQLVWGAKYRGKTNELVTQLALNVALRFCTAERKPLRLLDPMAGRGTPLLWALRYGVDAVGIERDPAALDHLQRHVKRQTKLHRIKHSQSRGFVGKRNRQGDGGFVQYEMVGRRAKLIAGDSRLATELLRGQRFELVVADLPYGVQHVSRGGTRNPMATLAACAPGWVESLASGGVMVLVFNALQPRRAALLEVFEGQGLVQLPFAAPHRMSESILRDLAVLHKP